jgi:hypothetical protein
VLVHKERDMRARAGFAFDDMNGVDVLHDFESVAREVADETSEEANEADGDSVWLECSGELLDARSVKLVGVRNSACGFETLVFICPRCNQPHDSVRFS